MSADLAIPTIETTDAFPARKTQIQLAVADIVTGMQSWWLWRTLAWQDIRQRYRGSILGPFWLTLSMGIMVAALGFLYSTIWKAETTKFIPYLALGMLFWGLISSLVNDATSAFEKGAGMMLQVKMPMTVHVMRSVVRNLIIFLHNCVVGLAVLLYYGVPQSLFSFVTLIGLAFILLNGFWVTFLLGMICARFRDIGQIVSSLTQIVFFLTPIIWMPDRLGDKFWVMYFNPAYAFLELGRGPLVGDAIPWPVWAVVIAVTIVGNVGTFFFFARFRARIPFWV